MVMVHRASAEARFLLRKVSVHRLVWQGTYPTELCVTVVRAVEKFSSTRINLRHIPPVLS
jgi:hypothetical protein